MKAFLFLILSCAAVCAQEVHLQYTDDPAKAPKRVVGDAVYDVAHQTNLWKMTTMTYVRPQIYTGGWVVMSKVDETNSFFVLRNPPTEVLQRFVQLKAEYQQVKADYDQAQTDYQAAVSSHDKAKLWLSQLKSNPPAKVGTKAEIQWSRDMYKATDNEQTLDQQCDILGAKVKSAKTDLDRLTNSGFDFSGNFVFSCPVMRVPLLVENLPVYDRGKTLPY